MVEFHFQKVEKDDERLIDLYKLRFQVYCTECGFENPEDHPGGIEKDEFDDVSTHFCAFDRETKEILGTARIILPSPKDFPINKHFTIDQEEIADIDPSRVAEISRLAISKDYRRRVIDKAIYADHEVNLSEEKVHKQRRKQFELALVAGLYRCIYIESMNLGLTHWYAVMAKGLYLLLKSRKILWHPIGPSQNYHGWRRPYVAEIKENIKSTSSSYPDFTHSPPGWNG
jgi:N-acyl amino acid synthase of PEP-CTERM/exosortase system